MLETYYHPTSFMRLSLTSCQPLFEELLLMLQPLSLLTFNLDLLFQHHHLEPHAHSPDIPGPTGPDPGVQLVADGSPPQTAGCRYTESLSEPQVAKEKLSPFANPKNGGCGEPTRSCAPAVKASVALEQTSPQLLWVQEKDIGGLPPPDTDEDSLAQQAGQVGCSSSRVAVWCLPCLTLRVLTFEP